MRFLNIGSVFSVTMFAVALAAATPLLADDVQDCMKRAGDTSIQACSRIIESGRLFGKPISIKNRAILFSNRGNAYSSKGDFAGDIADQSRAIKLNPKFANAFFNRGNSYARSDKHAQSIADLTKAIELNPKFSLAYLNRGIIFDILGNPDRAKADKAKAIQLNPKLKKR